MLQDENSPSLLHPCVHRNMPPVAGQLQICKELTERIVWPFEWFKHINHPFVYISNLF